MCGIAGIVDFRGRAVDRGRLERAVTCLAHRGPDDRGAWFGNAAGLTVGLGHTRLAVIGLGPAGRQPLQDAQGRFQIVFNGEIYNHLALRRELEDGGRRLRTATDTEVLLEGYVRWGEAVFDRLSGMWACAIYDSLEGRGLLCRDRFGVKPLVYGTPSEQLIFASEVHALACLADAPQALCQEALAEYLRRGWVAHPRTLWRGYRRLEPGSMLRFDRRGVEPPRRYYRVPLAPPDPVPEAEAASRLRQTLAASVRQRLLADVPVGAFLSGGLDSSIVVRELVEACSGKLQTFSIGYEGHSRYDESGHARAVAEFFRTDHQAIVLTFGDVLEALPRLLDHLAEPFADASYIPTALLSEVTRSHVTVALSGDGADELFGGYRRYLAHATWQRYQGWPAPVRRAFDAVLRAAPASKSSALGDRLRQAKKLLRSESSDPLQRHQAWSSIASQQAERLIDPAGLLPPQPAARKHCAAVVGDQAMTRWAADPMNLILLQDLSEQLPADMLHKVDLASMRSGLEVRVPMLDPAVVELAAALPSGLKIRGGRGKDLLRRAYGRDLPQAIVRRGKMGFELPIGEFLRGTWRDIFMDTVTPEVVATVPPLSHEGILTLYQRHYDRRDDHADLLYAILVLCWWQARRKS